MTHILHTSGIEGNRTTPPQRTHFVGCWRVHFDCAQQRIVDLELALGAAKHDAAVWREECMRLRAKTDWRPMCEFTGDPRESALVGWYESDEMCVAYQGEDGRWREAYTMQFLSSEPEAFQPLPDRMPEYADLADDTIDSTPEQHTYGTCGAPVEVG